MKTPISLYFDKDNQENLEIIEQCPTIYKKPSNIAEQDVLKQSTTEVPPSQPSVVNDATYDLSFLLKNVHLHNIYAAYQRVPLNLSSTRDYIINPQDGGTVSVDWFTFGTDHQFKDDTPTIVLLHGLTGGSHELYVQHLAKYAFNTCGYRSVVFNYRGCAENPVTADKTYCATWMDDLLLAISFIQSKIPKHTLLFAVGFSLGSSILCNYLKTTGLDSVFKAAVSVSNPLNMLRSTEHLESTFINNKFYNEMLGNNLKKMFVKWGNRLDNVVTAEQLAEAKTIKDVDELVTCKIHGYKNADEYYTIGSAALNLDHIKKPILFINAKDDPISPETGYPYQKVKSNPNTLMVVTEYGGHLGFLRSFDKHTHSIADEMIVEYLNYFKNKSK